VPPEFQGDADSYLDFALREVLPEAAQLAEAADVFLERGAFDVVQARRFLVACHAAGLALRLHGDQFTEQGAIPLAVELGARSVDHLEATGEDGVRALAASNVVGVLLPTSALFLDRPMPPARALVDAGATVALATDFNPGSSFTTSLPLVCSLACTQLHLSPAEALAGVTVHAARVLGLDGDRGRIAPGLRADLTLLDAPDWRYLAYHLAGDVVAAVVRGGSLAFRR
jgi:imidazolonepropionase